MYAIRNLQKAFDGKAVLEDLNLDIMENQTTCVMGPSGGGKTTLLRILMGLLPADGGSLGGLPSLRPSAVFQEDRLCENMTPIANVCLICGRTPKERIQEALAALRLIDCAGQPVRTLSGGMRRRVAILRAVLAPFDILFLDEPFKGLDEETKGQTMTFVRDRCVGKTVVLVTHDASEAAFFGAAVVHLPFVLSVPLDTV